MNAEKPSPRPRPYVPAVPTAPRWAFVANSLLDADVSATSGFVCPIPCQRIADGRLAYWPMPKVTTNVFKEAVAVSLDLRAWCVTYDDGERAGVTLPLVCDGQQAARKVAETFAQHLEQGYADPANAEHLAGWCTWWTDEHDDSHLIVERRPLE
ncbi:MAG: hypothetical protein ACRDZY_00740 [Acidimicrobiales bacterium]